MAVDFPSSPALNDTYTSGGLIWTWDGVKWIAPGAGGIVSSFNTRTGAVTLTNGDVTAVLPPSSTPPLVDGTAAVGTGTTWARADHVHPLPPQALGDNRIINGNFAINQRVYVSNTALTAATYGHDRWKAGAAGCTYTFVAALPDTTINILSGSLTQVIEAGMIEAGVYTLSWAGTAKARVYQGAPTGSYVVSPLTTASLPAGVNTIVDFNAGTLMNVKLEIGAIATPFNRQSLAKTMADCQRYYAKTYTLIAPPGTASASGDALVITNGPTADAASVMATIWHFPVVMRPPGPNVFFYSGNSGAASKGYAINANADINVISYTINEHLVSVGVNSVSIGARERVYIHAVASGEL